jgi:hypothetical protein
MKQIENISLGQLKWWLCFVGFCIGTSKVKTGHDSRFAHPDQLSIHDHLRGSFNAIFPVKQKQNAYLHNMESFAQTTGINRNWIMTGNLFS